MYNSLRMLSAARISIAALCVALFSYPGHADSGADSPCDLAEPVRGYFQALARNDFPRAISLTVGAAQERTEHMVGTLRRQAAAAHAHVELKVRSVEVSPPSRDQVADGEPVPVDVQFDIDVVGRKWFFSRVARKLSGRAQFYVASAAPARIVAIEGNLE